jgi:hypothetical protein
MTMGWIAGVRFPAEDLCLLHGVQTIIGFHPASCPMDAVDFIPGGKAGRA